MKALNRDYIRGRGVGASELDVVRRIKSLSSVPHSLTGLTRAPAFEMTGVVVGEFTGPLESLG